MRGRLEGVTDGTSAAAGQTSGENASANATVLQHLPTAESRKKRVPTHDGQRAIDRLTMVAVQRSFIANLPGFNLRHVQNIKYISGNTGARTTSTTLPFDRHLVGQP
jgi:hypothetical protein